MTASKAYQDPDFNYYIRALYDPKTGTVGGRSGKSWGKF